MPTYLLALHVPRPSFNSPLFFYSGKINSSMSNQEHNSPLRSSFSSISHRNRFINSWHARIEKSRKILCDSAAETTSRFTTISMVQILVPPGLTDLIFLGGDGKWKHYSKHQFLVYWLLINKRAPTGATINKNLIFLHMELHHFKFKFYLQCRMKATERADHFAGASFYHNFYRVICI